MTSRTLSRKAAGNIKKDLKNSRAVLTVNESEIPANSITAFKEMASKSAHSYNPTINEVNQRMLYYYYYHQSYIVILYYEDPLAQIKRITHKLS